MTPSFAGLADLFVFPAFLLFARLGTAIMVFPAISDPSISARMRLAVALGITLLLFPILRTQLPLLPLSTGDALSMLGGEMLVGLLMGLGARLMLSCLNLAGELIAFVSGFQAATLFDPQSGSSTAAPTLFLTLTAGLLILTLGFHHMLIEGVLNSYKALPAGQWPAAGGVADAFTHLLQTTFTVGLQLSAPVVVAGLMANVMFGIFNRLIPQLQVFFVSVPLSIALSLLMLAAALPLMFGLFTDSLHANMWLFDLPDS